MATYYWGPVAGNAHGVWSSSVTANWFTDEARTISATSAPKSSDDVVFDANSNVGAYVVGMNSSAVCRDILVRSTANGGRVTFNNLNISSPTVNGNLSFGGNVTSTGTGAWNFSANVTNTSLNKTIDFGNISVSNGLSFSNAASTWTFTGNRANHGGVFLTAGSLDFGNIQGHNFSSFGSSGTNNRAVNFGNCTIIFGTGGGWWSTAITTNLTFIAGTSHIISSDTGGSVQTMSVASSAGPGLTFNNVSIMSRNITISGNARFNDLTFGPMTITPGLTSIAGNITVDNVMDFGGFANNKQIRRTVVSADALLANSSTISAATVANLHNIDFENIRAAGASVPWSGTYLGNGGGNANITFAAPQTYYWNLPAGGSFFSNAYATVSGGGVDANNHPLAQDTVIFDDAGLNANANVITHRDGAVISGVDFSSRTIPAYFFGNTSSQTARIYGNINLGANTFFGWPGLSSQPIFLFSGISTQSINAPRLTNQAITFTVNKNTHSSLIISGNVGSFGGNPASSRFNHNNGNVVLNGGNLIVAQYSVLTTANSSLNWSHLESTGSGGNVYLYSTQTGTILSISNVIPNFYIWGEPWFIANGAGSITRSLLNADNQPLPSRWVNFRITEGTGTLQVGSASAYFNDFSTVGYTGNVDFRSVTIRGNLTLSSAHTVPPANNGNFALTLNNPDPIAKTIDTANLRLNKNIAITAGDWQLSNNLSIGSNVTTSGFSFTSGNVRVNGYDLFTPNVSIGSGNTTRSLFLGSGNVVLTSTGNVWSVGTPISNFTFNANTSTIIIADTSSNAKGFVGGSLTYNNVRLGA